MSGADYLKGHSRTAKAPGGDKAWAGTQSGPYIAIVKNNVDPLRMGRLQVNIPAVTLNSIFRLFIRLISLIRRLTRLLELCMDRCTYFYLCSNLLELLF